MRKSKSDWDAVKEGVSKKEAAGGLLADLLVAIDGGLTENNARSFRYMMAYYGLNGQPGQTLEAIGGGVAGGLTRERVRQIIDGALGLLLKQEAAGHKMRPYEKSKEIFNEKIAADGRQFLRLSEFVKDEYFATFKENSKGLIAFLNDAGIRQVVYRGAHYIYPEGVDRRDAIEHIQSENKKIRRAKTLAKMDGMAKTVTYVPTETREFLLETAEKSGQPLNRLYEKILVAFMKEMPYKSSVDFEKTQSWRARKGKAEWSQVGIYIDKKIFDQVKEMAAKVRPEPVSNMSYICQAFVAYRKGGLKV